MRGTDATILVTGGSAGIGLAIAERLASEGNAVVLAARDPARLDAACARLRGRSCSAAATDPSPTGLTETPQPHR